MINAVYVRDAESYMLTIEEPLVLMIIDACISNNAYAWLGEMIADEIATALCGD